MVSLKLALPLFLIAPVLWQIALKLPPVSTRWRMRGMATRSWRPGAEGRGQALVKKLEESVFKDKTYQWFALRPMEAGPKNAAKASEATTRQGQTTGA